MAAVAEPAGEHHRCERDVHAVRRGDGARREPQEQQPVGRLERARRGHGHLELPGRVLRVELLDGHVDGLQRRRQVVPEVAHRHQRADAVARARRGRLAVAQERHLDLERRLRGEALRGQTPLRQPQHVPRAGRQRLELLRELVDRRPGVARQERQRRGRGRRRAGAARRRTASRTAAPRRSARRSSPPPRCPTSRCRRVPPTPAGAAGSPSPATCRRCRRSASPPASSSRRGAARASPRHRGRSCRALLRSFARHSPPHARSRAPHAPLRAHPASPCSFSTLPPSTFGADPARLGPIDPAVLERPAEHALERGPADVRRQPQHLRVGRLVGAVEHLVRRRHAEQQLEQSCRAPATTTAS